MNRKLIILIAEVGLLLTSCGNGNDIVIEGTLKGGEGKVIYIEEMTPDSRLFIDSITLDSKGHFKFKYAMPYKTFYNVHVSDADYVVLLPDPGEKITMTGDYESLSTSYRLQGAGDSQLLWQLQDYSNMGSETLRDIVAADQANRELLAEGKMSESEYEEARMMTDSVYIDAFTDQQQYVSHFIEENLGNLSTLIALYKPFNNRPLIDPEKSFEFYEAVLDGLEESLPDNPHTISFRNQVERTRFQYAR